MFVNADLVITTTHYVAAEFRAYLAARGLPVPRILVVQLPAQLANCSRRTSKHSSLDANQFRLLTVSTWEPRKNLPRLLRSLVQAQSITNKTISLTIVGSHGMYTNYIDEVRHLLTGMSNVTTFEWIDNETLVALYDRHDAAIYPSWEEGFGLPIMESLWMATPCICHSGSSMAEIAPGGGTVLVDMLDETAIASAICKLAESPSDIAMLRNQATSRALMSWFDYAHMINDGLASEQSRA
ncbi:glycosyltransferase [Sphingomonas sp. R86521]|uniref:glycosyltransferase n=1 Tax=Sphingomonas sp. R86521 TaxID=3093860 RepID=UPI0036D26F7D